MTSVVKKYPSAIKVGRFTEPDLVKGRDKTEVELAKVKTGYQYVITKWGKNCLDIYLISNQDYYKTKEI
jgi:hypothetical protein